MKVLIPFAADSMTSAITEQFVKSAIRDDFLFDKGWLTQKQFVGVPIITDDISPGAVLNIIQNEVRAVGAIAALFWMFDEFEGFPRCVRVPVDAAVFRSIESHLAPLRHAVISPCYNFAVVFLPPEGVGVVAGTSTTVQAALGKTAAKAQKAFDEFISQHFHSGSEADRKVQTYLAALRGRYQA